MHRYAPAGRFPLMAEIALAERFIHTAIGCYKLCIVLCQGRGAFSMRRAMAGRAEDAALMAARVNELAEQAVVPRSGRRIGGCAVAGEYGGYTRAWGVTGRE